MDFLNRKNQRNFQNFFFNKSLESKQHNIISVIKL